MVMRGSCSSHPWRQESGNDTQVYMPKNHGHGAHKESPIVPPVCIITSAWCIASEARQSPKSENAIGATQPIRSSYMLYKRASCAPQKIPSSLNSTQDAPPGLGLNVCVCGGGGDYIHIHATTEALIVIIWNKYWIDICHIYIGLCVFIFLPIISIVKLGYIHSVCHSKNVSPLYFRAGGCGVFCFVLKAVR
jgi:hypothetical protein